MAFRSKAYKNGAALIEEGRTYSPLDALRLAQKSNPAKFDASVEVSMRLGVDPRKADQMVRGTVNLPNGTGKTARVVVFANGDKAEAAREAGADFVGSDDLIEKVQGGWTDFDAAVATPDLMGKVGRLGKILGPRNLMPNPKTGTVTMDVAKAVNDIKGGKIDFRVDKHSNLHFIVGKASFSAEALTQNYAAALEEVLRLKPSASKGRYISKATVVSRVSKLTRFPAPDGRSRVGSFARLTVGWAGTEDRWSRPNPGAEGSRGYWDDPRR
jgi:large subunit ribosomal protein L1